MVGSKQFAWELIQLTEFGEQLKVEELGKEGKGMVFIGTRKEREEFRWRSSLASQTLYLTATLGKGLVKCMHQFRSLLQNLEERTSHV